MKAVWHYCSVYYKVDVFNVMGFLRITVFLISLSYQGKSDKIRCYCNLEKCISANFSCSYENDGCFSDFSDYRNTTQAKHGCLHLLSRERQEQCGSSLGSSGSPRSLLFCCKADMCNQVLGSVSTFTRSIIGSLINATERQNGFGLEENFGNQRYNRNEVWFKAATIAVPICGAMILFLLVALAFKILRADNVAVEKYCGKTKSNANYTESHIISFKPSELNSKDLSKKIPLLFETQQNELQNPETFRSCTSARIHFGQNVNILKTVQDSGKVEKNLENAKLNVEKPWVQNTDVPTTSHTHGEDPNNKPNSTEDNSNTILDVRVEREESSVLPALSLNLNKSEIVNNCNLYRSTRSEGQSSLNSNDLGKLYDKRFL